VPSLLTSSKSCAEVSRVTPEEFAQRIDEWARRTMVEAHGTRFLLAGPRPEPGQPFPGRQRGALTAEAEIVHRGRTTLAVEVTVLDEHSD